MAGVRNVKNNLGIKKEKRLIHLIVSTDLFCQIKDLAKG